MKRSNIAATSLLGFAVLISVARAQSSAGPSYDPDLVTRLAEAAGRDGDPDRGAAVFADARFACISCHRVGRHGGSVGPELTAIRKQRQVSHLIESLFWPERELEPEYTLWEFLTRDGDVRSGYRLPSDDDQQIVLRDPANGTVRQLAAAEIEAERKRGTPMPAGLTVAMTRQQQLDVIRFLSTLKGEDDELPMSIDSALARAATHGPATFPYQHAPLFPERWPHHRHPKNEHRLYDFYTKQAEFFRTHPPVPHLLSAFPGLDGGEPGHWGYQKESDWADGRWNEVDLGTVQCGIFRGGDLRGDAVTVPRGVCIRLGDDGELAACFNPDTLSYDAVWSGGFVTYSDVRHGFMDGVRMEGKPEPFVTRDLPPGSKRYLGYYRSGKRIAFSYQIGEVEYLDMPWVEEGKFVQEVAPVTEHSWRHARRGSAPQWPRELETSIHIGNGHPYAVDTIELPFDNPWNAQMFCAGHDFLPDGSALVCTIQGDVWHVKGLDRDRATWRRFAAGLNHALGLVVSGEEVFVQGRDQLTRLHDRNGDGEADFYECFSHAFETSVAGHDFICGLQRDAENRFYTASGNQGLIRISADGETAEVIATGFRNPDGLGILPDGTVTVPCSEGEWTPASMICAVPPVSAAGDTTPRHYGYLGPRGDEPPQLPLAYLPRGLDNSSGEQVYVDSDRWGPLSGQVLHLSFGMGRHFLLLRDEVRGQAQGAIVPLGGDFRSGIHRGRFRQKDGQLYVSGMDGWVSFTPDDGCFQRVRYTGDANNPPQLPLGFHLHENGVVVRFARSLDRAIAEDVNQHFAQCWNYRYSPAYGSAELSPSHPGVAGHDPLAIRRAVVLRDGRSLFLELPELQPVSQLHLRLNVDSSTEHPVGHDLFVTAHRLDEPFTEYPGYRPREKVIAAHPLLSDLALNAVRVPNPWQQPLENARRVTVVTGKNLTFATRQFRVNAGEPVRLVLQNPDVVPHNWAVVAPGKLQEVGELANRLIADPTGFARHYIPRSPHVIAYTDVVAPGSEFEIYFRAPAEPGKYPFLCTFPGHWMVMNGVMTVE